MEIKNELEWSMAQQGASQDESGVGKQFLQVAEFWADTAERILKENPDSKISTVDAYRTAYSVTEAEFGDIDEMYVGQLILVHSTFWVYGEDVLQRLSPLEMLWVRKAMALRNAEMARRAEAATEADMPQAAPSDEAPTPE